MKRVCILYSNWYNASNGASRFVKTLLCNKEPFSKEGVDFEVVSRDLINPRVFTNGASNSSKSRFKSLVSGFISKSSLLTILYTFFIDERYNRQIVKTYLNKGMQHDAIHFQELDTCYYFLKYRSGKSHSKTFLTLHTNGQDFSMLFLVKPAINSKLGRRYLNKRLNFVIKNVDRIGFVSKNSMETFAQNHPDVKDKLTFVYNGIKDVEPSSETRQNDVIDLITVGTVCQRKNQRSILDAIGKLNEEEKTKIKLTVAGDGPDLPYLKEQVEKYHLSNIELLGNCLNVDDYLCKSNAFILPSLDEGLPISIIEGMRRGLLILGSNVAGIPEMIQNGESGYIIDTSVESIVDSLRKLLQKKPEEIRMMGEKSRQLFLEKFLESLMIKQYAQEYLAL
ncbi:MAG: glycosyltransferase family 4 protein [Lachnospiraceae bacterium]|nr:glycosyltransferase family 4 protein [Lachnospiraceae bacterium]